MGQWGKETFSGDSVMDYLQHCVPDGDLDLMTPGLAAKTLNYSFRGNQGNNHFEKLGVVVWLLAQGFIVPVGKIEKAMDYANEELNPITLRNWPDPHERQAQIIIEMNEMRVALGNNGQGVKRTEQAKGLAEKALDFVEALPKVEIKDNEKHITLPCFGIKVVLIDPDPNYTLRTVWQGGSITSDMKEVCEHCNDINCELDCEQYRRWTVDRDYGAVLERRKDRSEWIAHRAAVDALELFILNAAISGLHIEEPAFVEAIETTLDGLGG